MTEGELYHLKLGGSYYIICEVHGISFQMFLMEMFQ